MLPRYEEPTVEVIIFEVSDILTISGGTGYDDTIELPDVGMGNKGG